MSSLIDRRRWRSATYELQEPIAVAVDKDGPSSRVRPDHVVDIRLK